MSPVVHKLSNPRLQMRVSGTGLGCAASSRRTGIDAAVYAASAYPAALHHNAFRAAGRGCGRVWRTRSDDAVRTSGSARLQSALDNNACFTAPTAMRHPAPLDHDAVGSTAASRAPALNHDAFSSTTASRSPTLNDYAFGASSSTALNDDTFLAAPVPQHRRHQHAD